MNRDFKLRGKDAANDAPVAVRCRRHLVAPLPYRQAKALRAGLAAFLYEGGLTFRAIRQVLNLSGPDEARKLVARWRSANQTRITRIPTNGKTCNLQPATSNQ